MKDECYIFNISNYKIKTINERYLLFDNKRGKLLWVNRTGYSIIERLDGKHTVEEIIEELTKEYGLDKNIIAEYVQRQIKDLFNSGLIVSEERDNAIIDYVGINRLYIEIAHESGNRLYLKEIGKIEETISFVINSTKEERIILFLDCSKVLDLDFLQKLLELINNKPKLETFLRVDYRIMNEQILNKINAEKTKIVFPYDEKTIKEINSKDIFEKKVDCLLKKRISCYIGITVEKNNQEAIANIQQYGFDIGMTGIFLDDVDLENSDAVEKLYKNNMFLNSWKNNRIKWRENYFVILMYKNFCQNLIQSIKNKCHCGLGIEELYIDFFDNVYPCHRLKLDEFKYNGLSDFFKRRQEDFGESIVDKNCKNCFAWTLCNGGCKAENIMHNISLFAPNINCKNKKENVEHLFS